MYETNHLDPAYAYLPYCAQIEEVEDPTNPKRKLKEVSYCKTYPAYPWKLDDGFTHEGEDPIKFINICAQAGLVKWETTEEKEARLARKGITDRYVSYSDYLRDQALIQNMPEG